MGNYWKLGYGKGEAFFFRPLMFSQLLEAIKALKPCLLAGGLEICISAGGCFDLMSADSLVPEFYVSSCTGFFRRRGKYSFKETT